MRPMQIWLPLWEVNPLGSPLAFDIQRAFAHWDNDDVVWLIPWLDEVVRWADPSIWRQDVAVPANSFNRIGVYHMGRNGHIWGHGTLEYFPSGRIDDALLDRWLNVAQTGVPLAGEPPQEIALTEMPEFGDGCFIRYKKPALVRPQWTAANRPTFFLPKPLGGLLPLGGNLGQWAELEGMAAIAKTSANSLAKALRVGTAYASPYITKGITSLARASLLPIKVQEGEGGVIDATQPFVPNVRSLAQAAASPEWCDHVTQPVTIRRVWGIFGLFWTLLIEQLESMRPFSVCDECKRLLPGLHKRKHCGRQDDAECFKNRNRRAVQRTRGRRKPNGMA